MKQFGLVALTLILGITAGALITPSKAQQSGSTDTTCRIGESSNAACSGKWVIFAGNTSGVDSGAWVVRMNGETGAVWYKNGKKLVILQEPD